jgi:hypothetical protein
MVTPMQFIPNIGNDISKETPNIIVTLSNVCNLIKVMINY